MMSAMNVNCDKDNTTVVTLIFKQSDERSIIRISGQIGIFNIQTPSQIKLTNDIQN